MAALSIDVFPGFPGDGDLSPSRNQSHQLPFSLHIYFHTGPYSSYASLVAQTVKNLPAMRETWVRSLGCEDLLEKGKATHSIILTWRIAWTVYSQWGHKESNSTK